MNQAGDRGPQRRGSRLLDEVRMATATPDEVAVLLDAGASVHARDGQWRTALHVATDQNNHTVAALLLDRGADLDATDDDRCTALHHAAPRNSNPGMLAPLLDRDTDPNTPDNYRRRSLHFAARPNKNPRVLKLLLERGANAAIPNTQGDPAAELADGEPDSPEEPGPT